MPRAKRYSSTRGEILAHEPGDSPEHAVCVADDEAVQPFRLRESPAQSAGLAPDDLLARGVLLMIAIKLVGVKWIGLDANAWYVWPWTWVAFAMMVPGIVEWVNECRRESY